MFYFASHFSCLPVTNIEESYHAIAIPGENLISDTCDGAVSLLVIVQFMTIQVRIGTKLFRKLRAFPFLTILNPWQPNSAKLSLLYYSLANSGTSIQFFNLPSITRKCNPGPAPARDRGAEINFWGHEKFIYVNSRGTREIYPSLDHMNKVRTKNSEGFSGRNQKFKQFFRAKTGDLQKKRSSLKFRRIFRPKS